MVPPSDVDKPFGDVRVAGPEVVFDLGDAHRCVRNQAGGRGDFGQIEPESRVVCEERVGRVRLIVVRNHAEVGRGEVQLKVNPIEMFAVFTDRVHRDVGDRGRNHGEQRHLLHVVFVDLVFQAAVGLKVVVVAFARRAQDVAAGLGNGKRVGAKARIVRDVHVCLLAGPSGLPADEATDRLAEEQLGRRRGREHADAQPRDVDALRNHSDRHQPGAIVLAELSDLLRRARVVTDDNVGRNAKAVTQQNGDVLGMFLVGRNHQTTSIALLRTDDPELVVCLLEHGRHPLTLKAECCAEAHRRLVLGQLILEVGRHGVARWRRPLHFAIDSREIDGPDNAAVAERIGVAIRVVGVSKFAFGGVVVPDERNRCSVTSEWRARERKPLVRMTE